VTSGASSGRRYMNLRSEGEMRLSIQSPGKLAGPAH